MNGMGENIVTDQWLSYIINKKAYKVVIDNSFVGRKEDFKNSLMRITNTDMVFIYAKVPVDSLDCIDILEDQGFHLVDTNISFGKPLSSSQRMIGNCDIRLATPDDDKQTVELARRSFKYSRFHLDNFFSKEVANNIKAQWVHSFFSGKRGDTLIVALVDKTVVGFLQIIQKKERTLIIDLIAVDSNFRGKGIAKDMIIYSQIHFRNMDYIRVGTQLANKPSISLYENLCFRFIEANYVFHYHSCNVL